ALLVGRRVVRSVQHLPSGVLPVGRIGVVESVATLVVPGQDGARRLLGHWPEGDLHAAGSFALSPPHMGRARPPGTISVSARRQRPAPPAPGPWPLRMRRNRRGPPRAECVLPPGSVRSLPQPPLPR